MSENEWPLITITILAFNRKEEVGITLNKINKDLDYPKNRVEIIVVDNASIDGTSEFIKKFHSYVKLIKLPTNIGVSGWNVGFANGCGDYFLVLDDDSCIESGLKEAISYLQRNKKFGILGCQIVGGAFTTEKLTHLQDWWGFIGAGAIISRDLYEAIGGFSEWIFLYSHEWEYGIRALNAGFKIKYFKHCIVNHRTSVINRSNYRLRKFTTRNELGIIHSYFRGPDKLLLFLRTLFWNCQAELKYGFHGIVPLISGFKDFLFLETNKQKINEDVLLFYRNNMWSCKPVLKTLLTKFKEIHSE